jgi:hypothetical protein
MSTSARATSRPSQRTRPVKHERLQMRQDLAAPILEQFHTWLEAQGSEVLPMSPMAEALGTR